MGQQHGQKKRGKDIKKVNWDNSTPKDEYFNELSRVSKKSDYLGCKLF